MNILKKILEKLKNIFIRKQEIMLLDTGVDYSKKQKFKETLKVKFEEVLINKKKVESHICYGDGMGIKKKIQY